jgi:uncharacterized protein YhaN
MENAVQIARGDVRIARESADGAMRDCDDTSARIDALLSKYPAIDRLNLSDALTRVEEQTAELDRAQTQLQAAKTIVEALPEVTVDKGSLTGLAEPPPGRTREELENALRDSQSALDGATARYNAITGELRALGDPAVLGSERSELKTRLDALNAQYAAIETAIEVLGKANAEMSSRFSPLLTAEAREIISRLTGGKYEAINVTRDFAVSAKETGGTLPRDLLWLSAGTSDQAYLALRLALVSVILPQETRCPVILDDALSNFDDTRTGYALEYLQDMAKTRQVILFTCGGREPRYFENDGRVNIVRL